MKSGKVWTIVFILLLVSIPGLLWKIIDPYFGLEIFGPSDIKPLNILLWSGLPSTIIGWICAVYVYIKLRKTILKETSKKVENAFLNGGATFIVVSMGFTLNWLGTMVADVYLDVFDWEFADFLSGSVLIAIYSFIPAIIGGVLAFISSILYFKKGYS